MHDKGWALAAMGPLAPGGGAPLVAARRALERVTGARGRRVLLLLAGVWVLNVFDLSLTLRAWADGILHEENPLALAMLQRDPAVLFAFKLVIVAAGTAVLFNLRRFRCAELASTLVLVVYAGVAVQWRLCYEMYDLACAATVNSSDYARLEALMRFLPVL